MKRAEKQKGEALEQVEQLKVLSAAQAEENHRVSQAGRRHSYQSDELRESLALYKIKLAEAEFELLELRQQLRQSRRGTSDSFGSSSTSRWSSSLAGMSPAGKDVGADQASSQSSPNEASFDLSCNQFEDRDTSVASVGSSSPDGSDRVNPFEADISSILEDEGQVRNPFEDAPDATSAAFGDLNAADQHPPLQSQKSSTTPKRRRKHQPRPAAVC